VTVQITDGPTVAAMSASGRGEALCIRPESVVIGEAAATLDNSFEGRIEDTVYTTGSVRYRVRLDGTGHLITARIPSHPDILLMQPGEPVKIGWSRRDTLLVEGK